MRKGGKRDECLILIANNVLVYLKWKMKRRAYLLDDADLDNETDEEDEAVNVVYNIVGSDVKKEIHLYGSNW